MGQTSSRQEENHFSHNENTNLNFSPPTLKEMFWWTRVNEQIDSDSDSSKTADLVVKPTDVLIMSRDDRQEVELNTQKNTPSKPVKPKVQIRNYEFFYDQNFFGVQCSLVVVLDGRTIGLQLEHNQKFYWFIKNPNHLEIQYNLLIS